MHLPLASWEDSRACFTWGTAVGPDTQGCREGELLQVPASRAELIKASRKKKKKSANKQMCAGSCARGAWVGVVMCCEWNLLFYCEGER